MSRNYAQRCLDRLERLRRRAAFLAERIALRVDVHSTHDQQERSAVLWAIEQIAYLDVIADVIASDQADAEKIAAVASVIRSRLRPTAQDVDRTPGLRRTRTKRDAIKEPV